MKRQKRPPRQDGRYAKLRTAKRGDDDDDSSPDDETELFVKRAPHREAATVERVVEEGDTLRAIAVRHRCTVEELKRLNHILNDNEIHAKGKVKVPDRPFSEILVGIHTNTPTKKDSNSVPVVSDLVDVPSNDVNYVIFNSTITSRNCDTNECCDEEEVMLLPTSASANHNQEVFSKFTCNGADGDISWVTLMVIVVMLIIAVPLIYVFYIAEHHEEFPNTTTNHNHKVAPS